MNPVEAHQGTGDLDSLRAAQGLDLVEARDTSTTTTKLTPAARCAVRGAISEVTSAGPASVPSGAIPEHWPTPRASRQELLVVYAPCTAGTHSNHGVIVHA